MTPSETDAKEIVELTETLLRAYARIAVQEAFEDDEVHLVPGATEAQWDAIEASFRAFDVPFDPALKALYGRTLGLRNPLSYIPVIVPPFTGANVRENAIWEVLDLEGLMDTMHLWPQEWVFDDPDAFPFLVIAYGCDACLTIDDRGSWSAKAYFGDGGALPERADFTLSLVEAFRTFAERMQIEWACATFEDDEAWRRTPLDPAALPEELRAARDRLTAPLDLDALPLARIEGRGPQPVVEHKAVARAPRPDGEIEIVGLPFGDYERVRHAIAPGAALRLHPVDDNPHDAQAVEVWFDGAEGGPARVGFVPRQMAPEIRARLAAENATPVVSVSGVGAGYLWVLPQTI